MRIVPGFGLASAPTAHAGSTSVTAYFETGGVIVYGSGFTPGTRVRIRRARRHKSRTDAGTQQAMRALVSSLHALVREGNDRKETEAVARRIWSGGADPVPARAGRWRGGPLGDRFFGGADLGETRNAPCLATAQIPDAAVIAADSDVIGVPVPALDAALPGLSGQAAAHPLIAGFATEYRCALPGDAEVLERRTYPPGA